MPGRRFPGVSVVRIQSTVIALAALAATEASASSITTLEPGVKWPSVAALGQAHAVDPSIVAATPLPGSTPSIISPPDTPADQAPSIIALGDPAPASEAAGASGPSGSGPVVIRGGEVGDAAPRPAQAARERQPTMQLDPNDKGTPAKRKALKRQAERLAKKKAKAQSSSLQPDPSARPPAPGT